jgi:hypothetical protein
MGQIALWAAIAAFIGAGLFGLLSFLGFRHSRHVPGDAELLEGHQHVVPTVPPAEAARI